MNSGLISLSQLLQDSIVEIPRIQRAYAQGRTDARTSRTRERFLEAIKSHIEQRKPMTLDFIYGKTERKGEDKEKVEGAPFIPLDGQQRLTTLFLLYWYAAKRERKPKEEYQFLNKFHYKTRESARVLMERLVSFNPAREEFEKLSGSIMNQYWYASDWRNDATIAGMLVMLDAIHEKFGGIDDLWGALDEIRFYFKDIEELGLTDEVYIKMNSRGKELTLFEHFKAELEKVLRERGVSEEIRSRIAHKIDGVWTDIMWHYRDKDREEKGDVGDMFLNYFHFVCDVICYRRGGSAVTLRHNELDAIDLVKLYFKDVSVDMGEEAILLMERFLDSWCAVREGCGFNAFWNSLLSKNHQVGKVMTYDEYNVDLLEGLLKGDFDYNKSPGRFVMLYAVQIYLLHREEVSVPQLVRRLRILNNLIYNSTDVADRPNSDAGNRLPAIFEQAEKIILREEISNVTSYRGGFGQAQIEEELQKQALLKDNPQLADELFRLEDHELLKGRISIIGVDNHRLFAQFHTLFDCDWDKVDCALLSIGDYSQKVRASHVIFSLGTSNRERSSHWRALLTEPNRYGYANTQKCLRDLLSRREITDEVLTDVANEYLKRCEGSERYDWRYYYIKYPSFRPGEFGKYYRVNGRRYELVALRTSQKISTRSYDVYLNEAIGHVNEENNGLSVTVGDYQLYCLDDVLVLKDDNDVIVRRKRIRQDDKGVDSENRIDVCKQFYEQLCKEQNAGGIQVDVKSIDTLHQDLFNISEE